MLCWLVWLSKVRGVRCGQDTADTLAVPACRRRSGRVRSESHLEEVQQACVRHAADPGWRVWGVGFMYASCCCRYGQVSGIRRRLAFGLQPAWTTTSLRVQEPTQLHWWSL